MKAFERIYPILTGAIIVLLVIYFAPTDLTGRYNNKKAMQTLDKNGDEMLEASEILGISSFLDGLKKTSTGEISLVDLDIKQRDLPQVIDMDENDVLSKTEIGNAVDNLKKRDEDQDGMISLKELK